MHNISFVALGCQITATLDSPRTDGETLLAYLPVWFRQWELSFSLDHPQSEISQLNAANGLPTRVSRTFWSVVRIATEVADQSDGLIALLSTQRTGRTDWRSIQFDPFTSTLRLPRGASLDITSVARSWALNMAMHRFTEYGPTMISTPNEAVVSGPMSNGSPWETNLTQSTLNRQFGHLMLGSGAAATSTRNYSKQLPDAQSNTAALIDPRTNRPANTDLLSATVLAPDSPTATMAARTVLFLGSKVGLPWIEARPHLAALFVNEQGQIITTRNMHNLRFQQARQVGAP